MNTAVLVLAAVANARAEEGPALSIQAIAPTGFRSLAPASDRTVVGEPANAWNRLLRDVAPDLAAHRTHIEEGVPLLRLADRVHSWFERQEPAEKRRFLGFPLSNRLLESRRADGVVPPTV